MKNYSTNKSIIVTGPKIHIDAQELAISAGFSLVYSCAYFTEDLLINKIKQENPFSILSRMGKISENIILASTNLKIISRHGTGFDNIDLKSASENNLPVVIANGENSTSVAEHTISLILLSVKRIIEMDASLRKGNWGKATYLGREISGMKLGLVGFGSVAIEVARLAQALGMQVMVFDPYKKESEFSSKGVERIDIIEKIFQFSDVISLHCPLTSTTKHIVNSDCIKLMKPNSYLVNTARGGLIDEEALYHALKNKQIAGAGLDTFEVEPADKNNPLWELENVVVTPHIAGVTEESARRVGVAAVRAIINAWNGDLVDKQRIVNFEELKVIGCRLPQLINQ